MRGFVIAGTSSGVGKTTATLAVMDALTDEGDVQGYKVGPDYIDPSHHEYVTGKPSRTLDLHMMGEDGVRRNYARGDGEYGVVEGVMGMYDSYDESTAKVAETLGLPVVLVVDATAGMESVAATALGFAEYAQARGSDVEVAGVIANKASSDRHVSGIRDGLEAVGIDFLGNIPRSDDLEVPSRHLGLEMGDESPFDDDALSRASDSIDTQALESVASEADTPDPRRTTDKTADDADSDIRVGVARDSAFSFYYPRSLEVLSSNAEVVTFSPLEDELPEADAYYFGGGYPELHPEKLEDNESMRSDVLDAASEGKPILGECGGFMYLSESLTVDGETYEMAGVLPSQVEMTESLEAVGYTEVEPTGASDVLGRRRLNGHEFHYSKTQIDRDATTAFDVVRGKGIDGDRDGVVEYNTVGCYTHLHPESQDYIAALIDR
ncbi:cobyrinate a,c-diamide synthase [Halorutilales archaeon Cl-col2-1]